ncbi:MAG: sugar ABC transporter ATP-binding protein [Spirochaetaceae bacterium]|nr:sugar ABC transporter ATP-binding protein [Spirochaetaceae bacterium]MCF7947506.1 sugar ABC transporter ATP-binding protein [Spirochaetia bacterium]MCF7952201.1 sugar ABC transporter ATP-binding protein [Spirochaetaceae bacterium]
MEETAATTARVLEASGISKTFPGVKALENVSLTLNKGEVLSLVGENGAGKSTLTKVLSGLYRTDHGVGSIKLNGELVHFQNAKEAKDHGLITIFQELSLVKGLTVAENVFLGNLPRTKFNLIDWHTLREQTRNILAEMGLDISPDELAGDLSISKQQMVEIARAFTLGAKVLIFDEPTSSLTETEKEILFKIIHTLREKGVGIIYITHKMDEVFEISDRITVLRDGKNSGDLNTSTAKLDDIISLMIGRVIDDYFHKNEAEKGKEILRVEQLSSAGLFKDINFSVRQGEVVGLYGLVGAGRTELAETIFGARPVTSGKVLIEGQDVRIKDTGDAVRLGLGFVPEDRKEKGVVLKMSCIENTSIAKLPWMSNYGFLREKEEKEIFKEYKDKLSISTPSPQQQVVKLSGGNQQKIVIAKWLCLNPRLLILDEPTRGIDVGSKAEIHKLIAKLAESGIAVIVISSEMPEIMGVSDRIMTMREGKISGEFTGDDITEQNLITAIAHVN